MLGAVRFDAMADPWSQGGEGWYPHTPHTPHTRRWVTLE